MNQNTHIGRIAPSPSGYMHLGNAYSSLLAWAHAKSKNGQFILRLEDLDERCHNPEITQQLITDLHWLGIEWDEEPYIQSDRLSIYEDALNIIKSKAEVFPCFCTRADLHAASAPHASDGTPIYSGACYKLNSSEIEELKHAHRYALRLHVPDNEIAFNDVVMGEYTQSLSDDCGDFVLRRSDGIFAYQLVCVVDDIASGVTEIVRGNDLLSSTPRQMYLYELFDAKAPQYLHHPLLVAPDGRRLAKRNKDCTIMSLRDRGAKPEDIIGYVAFSSGQIDTLEQMTREEFLSIYNASKIPKENVVVHQSDIDKLIM